MPLRRLLLALACVLALVLAAAAAGAATPLIGYGDQHPAMFSDPLFTQLGGARRRDEPSSGAQRSGARKPAVFV